MSFRGRRNFRGNNREKRPREESAAVQENSSTNPFLENFKIYQIELDNKHDRQERLVKLSRDVTIESKRIIFLLHNIDAKKNNKEQVLEEAKQRLDKLLSTNFKIIAKEIHGHDIFLYIRAISPGLQEFIEALTFYEYLSESSSGSAWEDIQKKMLYENEDNPDEKFSLAMIPTEFILGYADLTGEVMRYCINALGSGDTENCFKSCKFLQGIYANFITLNSIPNRGRDYNQKLSTMRASTLKCEHLCYNLIVRGSECQGSKFLPPISLDSFPHEGDRDDDEGFY